MGCQDGDEGQGEQVDPAGGGAGLDGLDQVAEEAGACEAGQ
ncbi:hypothetical protein ACFW5D_35220 [Streptomyces sp. NPDC058770]